MANDSKILIDKSALEHFWNTIKSYFIPAPSSGNIAGRFLKLGPSGTEWVQLPSLLHYKGEYSGTLDGLTLAVQLNPSSFEDGEIYTVTDDDNEYLITTDENTLKVVPFGGVTIPSCPPLEEGDFTTPVSDVENNIAKVNLNVEEVDDPQHKIFYYHEEVLGDSEETRRIRKKLVPEYLMLSSITVSINAEDIIFTRIYVVDNEVDRDYCISKLIDPGIILYIDDNTSGIWYKTDSIPYSLQLQTIEPISLFPGSRFSYNKLTKKLFYSTGKEIIEIAIAGIINEDRLPRLIFDISNPNNNKSGIVDSYSDSVSDWKKRFLRPDNTWGGTVLNNQDYNSNEGYLVQGIGTDYAEVAHDRFLNALGEWVPVPFPEILNSTNYTTSDGKLINPIGNVASETAQSKVLNALGQWIDVVTYPPVFSTNQDGLVPSPETASDTTYLNSKGEWVEIGTFDKNKDGLVPGPTTQSATTYLNSKGQWSTPTNTKYDTLKNSDRDEEKSYVIKGIGSNDTVNNKFLQADGQWKELKEYTAGGGIGIDGENKISVKYRVDIQNANLFATPGSEFKRIPICLAKAGGTLGGEQTQKDYLFSYAPNNSLKIKVNGSTVGTYIPCGSDDQEINITPALGIPEDAHFLSPVVVNDTDEYGVFVGSTSNNRSYISGANFNSWNTGSQYDKRIITIYLIQKAIHGTKVTFFFDCGFSYDDDNCSEKHTIFLAFDGYQKNDLITLFFPKIKREGVEQKYPEVCIISKYDKTKTYTFSNPVAASTDSFSFKLISTNTQDGFNNKNSKYPRWAFGVYYSGSNNLYKLISQIGSNDYLFSDSEYTPLDSYNNRIYLFRASSSSTDEKTNGVEIRGTINQ